ncbi:MAG: hypothetical protein V1902_03530 [Candidatus Falkowbacteria bacterium]
MLSPQHKLTIEELYLPGQTTNGNYICENFIVYPQDKEKYGGFIFGIVEIKATQKAEGEKIIQALVNTVKEKYYQQILASPQPQRLNLETILEYALQKANEVLLEMAQIGYITWRKENINFIIAVAKPDIKSHETNLYFTHHGQMNASLIHRSSRGGYKAINIIESVNDKDNHSQKLFSSTIAGKLTLHDRFLIATEAFSNIISAYQITKICDEYSIAGAKDYLRALILNNATQANFLTHSAIMLGMEKETLAAGQPISQLSMNELISTTKHTEKLLMPTIALNINEKIRSIISHFGKKQKPLQLPITTQKTAIWNRFPFAILYYIVLGAKNLFAYLAQIVTGKKKLSLPTIKAPIIQRMTLVAIVLVVIAIATTIGLVQHHKTNTLKAEAYAVQVEAVKSKLNDAEFAQIAQNGNDSLSNVLAAEQLLNQMPNENNDEKATNETLATQITNLKNKLLHIEKTLPQIFTEPLVNGQPVVLSRIDIDAKSNVLIGISGQNLYFINTESKNIENIAGADANIANLSLDEGVAYALTDKNELWQIETDKKISKLNFSFSQAPLDFAVYGNLYFINAGDNQIFKAKKNGTTFSEPQTWLKINSPLNQPVDLSIDGNIFVVDSVNKTHKFYAGKMENFMDTIIEPKPQQITKVFTSADTKYLYLFDPAGKRIVVLNKEGELTKQYLFETLDNITDFTVNEKDKKIYLNAGSKIYQADLTHL